MINKASYEDPEKHDAILKVCDMLASDELTESLTESGMIPCKKVEVNKDSQMCIRDRYNDYIKNITGGGYADEDTIEET